jgi:AbrB family looped-hinge helix DNA binding protein
MANRATTKMSSKGQVVIPKDIREQLNLTAGSQFVVVGDEDVVILKRITAPSLKEFDGLIKQARTQAKKAGFKKSVIELAIKQARGEE